MDSLNWENKNRMGLNSILDDIEKATKTVVEGQLKDIRGKFASLENMGIIPEGEKENFKKVMKEIEKQISGINN